jgi:hypothetical protein
MKTITAIFVLLGTSFFLNAQNYSGGIGSESNPFIIKTYNDLVTLSNTPGHWHYHFKQVLNIDASESQNANIGDHDNNPLTPNEPMGFSPIGNSFLAFAGHYETKDCYITNLYINRPKQENVGLFGIVRYASLSEIHLHHAFVEGGQNTGAIVGDCGYSVVTNSVVEDSKLYGNDENTGLFVGIMNDSEISNSSVGGNLYGKTNTGGFCGYMYGSSVIVSCSADVSTQTQSNSGGFVGLCFDSQINLCYVAGKITSTQNMIGGFCGISNNSEISNCISNCDAIGREQVGGFIGGNQNSSLVRNSKSSGSTNATLGLAAGFVAVNDASVVKNSYSSGFTKSQNPASFVGINQNSSIIHNCYASGFVSNGIDENRYFCYSNFDISKFWNPYLDMDTHEISEDDEVFFSDQNNQTINILSTQEFANKFNFSNEWKIDGLKNDAEPWVSNSSGRPYLYFEDFSVSNGEAFKLDASKFRLSAQFYNTTGGIVATKGFRYKKNSSTNWIYVNVDAKSIVFAYELSGLLPDQQYIAQAFVQSAGGEYSFGDAIRLDTRENTLPVSLTDFFVEYYNGDVELVWFTASEINNDYFTIEKSYDAQSWEYVDDVTGNGNTNYQSEYRYKINDSNRAKYYRLSQTDFDGTSVDLGIVNVKTNVSNETEISIYPNPASDFINIKNCEGERVFIYNSVGALISEYIIDNLNEITTIDLRNFEVGYYSLMFVDCGEIKSKQFAIVK